jgi:hypothetical protein
MGHFGLGPIVGYCFGGGILATMILSIVFGVAKAIKDARRAKRLRKLNIIEPRI